MKIHASLFAVFAGWVCSAFAVGTSTYVQDGLIHHWDGYDNAGTGSHVADTNRWIDLVRTDAMDLKVGGNAAFSTADGDYSLVREGSAPSDSRMAAGDRAVTTAKTIEIVLRRKAKVTYAVCLSVKGHDVGLLAMKNNVIGSNSTGYFNAYGACNAEFSTVTLVTDANGKHHLYTNGVESVKTSDAEGWTGGMNEKLAIGGRATNAGNCFFGRVYAVRLYSSVLTAEQIAFNHAMDVERFVNGHVAPVASDSLVIAGSPDEFGDPSPAYGVTNGLSVGDAFVCTVPAAWTNGQKTISYECVGYDVASSGVTVVSHDFVANEARAYAYVHPDWELPPRLTWRFGNERYSVGASSSLAGATVVSDRAWARPGERVTLTATYDKSTTALCRWEGVSGTVSGDTITFVMPAEPVSAVARFATKYFVSVDGDDANDGLSADTPLATLYAAVAKTVESGADAVVSVGAGRYELGSKLAVTNAFPVRIIAEEGAEKTFVVRTAAFTHMLEFDSAGSSMEGFTFTQSPASASGRGLLVTSGTLSGCVVSNVVCADEGVRLGPGGVMTDSLVTANSQSGSSALVQMFGGRLERCRIVGNRMNHDRYGEALEFWSGGTARNCLIADNTNTANHAAGVNVMNGSGLIENCTVANNVTLGDTAVAGLVSGGAVARNCIVYGNRNNKGVSDVSSSACSYCASTTALSGQGNLVVTKVDFADEASGDYRVLSGSTIDAATTLSWMATATDLAGNARVIGDAPDIGCYEYSPGALRASVTVSSRHALGTGAFTLTADVSGRDLRGLAYDWRVSRGGTTVATGTNPTLELSGLGVGVYDVELTVGNAAGDSFTWEEGAKLMTVHPYTVYVSKTSEPQYPYASWETAANDFAVAMRDVMSGQTVLVGEGVYTNTESVILNAGVTVRGAGGRDRTTFVRGKNGLKVFELRHSSARLEGVTFREDKGCAGLYFEVVSGTLADCALVGCTGSGENVGKITGGLMTNTIVRANRAIGRQTVFAAYGGIVAGCTFDGNVTDTDAYGAAVLAGYGVVLRNCLVCCNTNTANGAGVVLYLEGSRFENCTIAGNVTTSPNARVAAGVEGEGGRAYSCQLVNCIVSENYTCGVESNVTARAGCSATYTLTDRLLAGEGNKVGAPRFRRGAGKAWRIKSTSPAFNAGQTLGWMTETAVDLDGQSRIRNKLPDMGCCETAAAGLILLLR